MNDQNQKSVASKRKKSKTIEAPPFSSDVVTAEVIAEHAALQAPVVEAPVVEAPVEVEAPATFNEAPVLVKRVMQSRVITDKSTHSDDVKHWARRVLALNLGARDIFNNAINTASFALNCTLIASSRPLKRSEIFALSQSANTSNDLANKVRRKLIVHELGAYRLSDEALITVKRFFSDAPCLAMLKESNEVK